MYDAPYHNGHGPCLHPMVWAIRYADGIEILCATCPAREWRPGPISETMRPNV